MTDPEATRFASSPTSAILYSRRSIRRYQPQPPSDEVIRAILQGACQAPSSRNEQPWRYLVVADPETVAWMSARVMESPEVEADPAIPDPIYYNAPVVVLVLCPNERRSADTRLAAAYLLLAAEALGVGTCWLGDGRRIGKDAEACTRLGVPGGDTVAAAISLGYAAETPDPPGRREPEIVGWIGPKG